MQLPVLQDGQALEVDAEEMTVADLIEKLKEMPLEAKVQSVPSDCCGCGLYDVLEVTLNEDGCVAIDASKFA